MDGISRKAGAGALDVKIRRGGIADTRTKEDEDWACCSWNSRSGIKRHHACNDPCANGWD